MDIKGLHDIYQLRAPQSANRSIRRASVEESVENAATESSIGVDMIKISPEAAFRNKLDAAMKTYAQQSECGVSSDRLDVLRGKYSGGNCPVSGSETAQSLLVHLNTEEFGHLAGSL